MTYYIVNEPTINDNGQVVIPVELYDDVPEDISKIDILVPPALLLELADLPKAERIVGYRAIIEADARIAKFLEAGDAYDLFTGDLNFPITIQT
jgi:hypothetical protein